MAKDGNKAGSPCSLFPTVNPEEVLDNFIFRCKDKRSKTKALNEIPKTFSLDLIRKVMQLILQLKKYVPLLEYSMFSKKCNVLHIQMYIHCRSQSAFPQKIKL